MKRAAVLAATGALLRGLYYFIANVIPSFEASEWPARLILLLTAIVSPLAWAYFFASIWRNRDIRTAALAAAVVSALEIAIATGRQSTTFSALSVDTVQFVLGTLILALCWLVVLLYFAGFTRHYRAASIYIVLASVVYLLFVTLEFFDGFSQIRVFWSFEPKLVAWRLIATPLIWMFYWATQALFARSIQKA